MTMVQRLLSCLLALMLLVSPCCALAQETYVPDSFTFEGGSGRVNITCPQVEIKSGQPWATLVFDSPYYTQVSVDGQVFATACDEHSSTALIPARLNETMTMLGTTVAMSQAHEVAYRIHIRVDALAQETEHPALPGLAWTSAMELTYAEGFSVDHYEGGYALIDVKDSARYLVVPEDGDIPAGIDASIIILQKPLDQIYLAATSAMALFDALDALDHIRLSGTKASGWYIDHAKAAMEKGDILFAGKYSEPDFELLLREGCDLAIESMMISHSPKVKEMLELLGIPVFIDRSSYESHPLGRTEWIRLYGVLTDREQEAEAFFRSQASVLDNIVPSENAGKSVAFFYLHTDGSAVIRSASDYIAEIIRLAGGSYAFDDLADSESAKSSLSISMEEFYQAAVHADYLIYNATIDDPMESMDDLLAKSDLFADFKAVQEGNVWCTGKYLYQATDIIASLITDIHNMLSGQTEGMTFLYPLKGTI